MGRKDGWSYWSRREAGTPGTGSSKKDSEKALNPQIWIPEEQGLEKEKQGQGVFRSVWIREDLEVGQGRKTGNQKGKEGALKYLGWIPVSHYGSRQMPLKAICLLRPASLPQGRAEARAGSTGLPCDVA